MPGSLQLAVVACSTRCLLSRIALLSLHARFSTYRPSAVAPGGREGAPAHSN